MNTKAEFEALLESYDGSIESRYCSLANATAFINNLLKEISWIGFYLKKESFLVLGPFQGNIACEKIIETPHKITSITKVWLNTY